MASYKWLVIKICLLFKKDYEFVVVIIYVDDILLTGNLTSLIAHVKAFMHSQFKIKNLGPMKYFLGLEIARSDLGNFLNQRKYTLDILADTGMIAINLSMVLIEQNHTLIENTCPLCLKLI